MIKKFWLATLLLVALAPLFYLLYNNHSVVIRPDPVELGQSYDILACKVINGYNYEIVLSSGNRFLGQLPIAVKNEGVSFVINCLNQATPPPPTVILIEQVEDYWIVDIMLTIDGQRRSLLELLEQRGLLLYNNPR